MRRAQILKLCAQVGDMRPRMKNGRLKRFGPNASERHFTEVAMMKDAKTIRAGWPDFLMIRNGKAVGVEVKANGYGISDKQAEMFAALEKAGLPIFVWNPIRPDALIPWRKYYSYGRAARICRVHPNIARTGSRT